jgi:hypothetical protein
MNTKETTSWSRLNEGDTITALVNTIGVTNSYNRPERIDIPKGTVLQVPPSGTRMGDVFCNIVEGTAKCGDRTFKRFDIVGLGSNHKTSSPWDLGSVEDSVWKIS